MAERSNKIWISCHDIIQRNSDEETRNELYGNGYLARLSEMIAAREAAIEREKAALAERNAKRRAALARREEKKFRLMQQAAGAEAEEEEMGK